MLTSAATIPGRPPLRKANMHTHSHERSASVPGTWRQSPFSNAMLSAVAGPSMKPLASKQARARLAPLDQAAHCMGNRPLSPILSPSVTKTPVTAIPRSHSRSPTRLQFRSVSCSPSQSPARGRAQSPVLMQSPDLDGGQTIVFDNPPPVPPKDELADALSPIRANSTMRRTDTTRSHIHDKLSFGSVTEILPMPLSCIQVPSRAAPAVPKYTSQTSKSERSVSPLKRVASPDLSMMDKPIQNKGSLRKQKSAPVLSRAASDSVDRCSRGAGFVADAIEPQKGEGSLPTGLRPMEAVLVLPNSERDILHKHAVSQAESFEVLGSKLVAQLSRVCALSCGIIKSDS